MSAPSLPRSSAWPLVSRSRVAPDDAPLVVLFVLVTVATGFDYVWLGEATATAWLALLALAYSWLDRRRELALRNVLGVLGRPVVLPWLLLLGSISFTDALNEMSDASWSALVGYGLVALATFLAAATAALEADTRRVCTVLAAIVLIQGCLAVAQHFDIPSAWSIAETFAPWVRLDADDQALLLADEAQLLGRARGTHVFVHKFAPFLAVLTSMLMAPAFSSRRRLGLSQPRASLVRIAVLAGALGTLVTFSRAAIFGVALSAIVLCAIRLRGYRHRSELIVGIALVALIAWIGAWLGIYDHDGFARVIEIGSQQQSIESRTLVFARAAELFLEHPVLGSGTRVDTHVAGISIHSVVLRMFASYGIVGGLFYVLAVVGLLRAFLALRRTPQAWAGVWMAGGLCALATALLDSSTHTSGFLFRDVAQPAIFGVLAGQAMRIRWIARGTR